MIYRRENPVTPSKRFSSCILNPVGTKIKNHYFYVRKQQQVGRHFGAYICKRRKKSTYITKLNLWFGSYQNTSGVVINISLARRNKTFGGLLKYSNGAVSCTPLFSGAYIGQLLKVWSYYKNPKLYFFTNFVIGSTVPVAYLHITACFFNITLTKNYPAFFCRAGGTYCILVRTDYAKGVCTVKLPSYKFIHLHETAYVVLGRNSNVLIKGLWLGKAGKNIKKGFRPSVRGVAMNPIDHPHGGRTKSNSPERTPWGKVAKFNK